MVGIGFLAAAIPWLEGAYVVGKYDRLVGLVLLSGWLVAAAVYRWPRLLRGLLHSAELVAFAAIVAWVLLQVESRWQPSVWPASWIALLFTRCAGLRCAVVDGSLLVDAQQGGFEFFPGIGVVGIRPAIVLVLTIAMQSIWRDRRLQLRKLLGFALVVVVLYSVRYAFKIVQFVSIPNVLGERSHHHIAVFWSNWDQTALLIGLSVLAAIWLRPEPFQVWSLSALAKSTAVGMVIGVVLGLEDPGTAKAGRVLIDDRLSQYWAPAGRLLTPERYGDFSTYSFASLTEHLARRFAVTVNGVREFDQEYLSNFDVVILKTPKSGLAPEETACLDEWVRSGGGLLAVSDHTDLGGMSTILNALVSLYGMGFQFDSVSGSDGAAMIEWTEPLIPEHSITSGLGSMSFMTSCSIDLAWPAFPILTTRRTVATRGDYSASSNFGTMGAEPHLAQGVHVVAAAANRGKGRVVCFSDSTVLSSFCYFRDNHSRFLLRVVSWLNRRNTLWAVVKGLCLGMGLIAVAVRARNQQSIRSDGGTAARAAIIGVVVGFGVGEWVSGIQLPVPGPVTECPEVGIIVAGGQVVLPPVLGAQPESLPGVNLSTLAVVPQRFGAETRIIEGTRKDLDRCSAVMLLNPSIGSGEMADPPLWGGNLREWLERGGRLIVTSHLDHRAVSGDTALARALIGVQWSVAEQLEDGLHVLKGYLGEGTVWVLIGSELLDTTTFGHCMAVPTSLQEKRHAMVYRVFREVLQYDEQARQTYVPW